MRKTGNACAVKEAGHSDLGPNVHAATRKQGKDKAASSYRKCHSRLAEAILAERSARPAKAAKEAVRKEMAGRPLFRAIPAEK